MVKMIMASLVAFGIAIGSTASASNSVQPYCDQQKTNGRDLSSETINQEEVGKKTKRSDEEQVRQPVFHHSGVLENRR
jgi:hypothetical protein